jgi:hypothetical protein
MTAQSPDILSLRGQYYELCSTPLEDYLNKLRKGRRPAFKWTSTACWRGYVAMWEVRDGALYLVDLDGTIDSGGGFAEVRLADAMPWLEPPVLATWVTAELRCPEGRLVRYRHAGFASVYERDRLFQVEKGRVMEEWLRINPPEPVWYRIGPDGTRKLVEGRAWDAQELNDPFGPDETPEGRKFWSNPRFAEDEEGYILAGRFLRWSPPR